MEKRVFFVSAIIYRYIAKKAFAKDQMAPDTENLHSEIKQIQKEKEHKVCVTLCVIAKYGMKYSDWYLVITFPWWGIEFPRASTRKHMRYLLNINEG